MHILNKTKVSLFFSALFFLSLGAFTEAAVDPAVVELHYQNGVKFYKRGMYEKAVREFEKTLAFDSERKDAKEYLEKVQAAKDKEKLVDARKSKEAELSGLYEEGRKLYAKGDYEAARDVFKKILETKPVDDFASYYRERCEIFISRKLAREKKSEVKIQEKEQKVKDEMDRSAALESKKTERREISNSRVRIDEERRQAREEKSAGLKEEKEQRKAKKLAEKEEKALTKQQAKEEGLAGKQERAQAQEQAKEEKLALVRERQEARAAIKEEKLAITRERQEAQSATKEAKAALTKERRDAQLAKKEEKTSLAKERRDARSAGKGERASLAKQRRDEGLAKKEEKAALAKERKEEKKQAVRERKIEKLSKKEEKARALKKAWEGVLEEKANRERAKELYILALRQYSKKQYIEAKNSFEAVIDLESQGKKIYTHPAERLLEKMKKLQETAF
jgi:hypothetical protein